MYQVNYHSEKTKLSEEDSGQAPYYVVIIV